ncbi:PIG-L deacetylase family protein [Nonomuraea sp. NPDC050536]|uniref:PIG-L deacetylase family protein n=1 Tax=Nonomuraea sp. NPDC050536 TaxID=3364366 RepID=UPI0037CB78A2
MSDLVVIAPHMDDETLGCGGVLAMADDPMVVFVVAPTDDNVEIDQVADILGFRYTVLYEKEWEARLLSVDRRELVGRIESVLHAERPREVLIPAPSYHQDHVVTFEAGISATRPLSRNGYIAQMVASYEYPGSTWGFDGREIELNYYVDIESVRDLKLKAVSLYQSSQFGREVIAPDVVDAWATLRGSSVGLQYAEAFRILRLVNSRPS